MIHLKIGQLKLSPKTIKFICIGCFINGIELGIIYSTAILENTQWGIYAVLITLYMPWVFLGPKVWSEMESQEKRLTISTNTETNKKL